MIPDEIINRFRVRPGSKVRLKEHDTTWAQSDELREHGKDAVKERAQAILEQNRTELAAAQEMLYADDRYSILVILQAMDAAGKDGTIKHVFTGVNPLGCEVHAFKQPSAAELDHTFLWRCMKVLPPRGRIGIFNRSYYEEVLVVKVHPEWLATQKLPPGKRGATFWRRRYDDINRFERHLARNGTKILKFFLNVSKDEQKRRFLERIDDPKKNWKFSLADVAERAHWDEYMRAYEAALSATSTKWAPWYVIPADDKWVARTAVADILTSTIRGLDLQFPQLPPEQHAELANARSKLEQE